MAQYGADPEEIARKFGHLSLAQVHAALAYYHANMAEIDSDLAREAAASDLLERGRAPKFLREPDRTVY